MRNFKLEWIVKAVLLGILFVVVIGFGTMWLWNTLAVGIFGLPVLTFWQTLGLMLLGRLLTGGFGKRGGGGWQRGKMMLKERWRNMDDTERNEFMRNWGKHHPRNRRNAAPNSQDEEA
jgi:hypothetical protein